MLFCWWKRFPRSAVCNRGPLKKKTKTRCPRPCISISCLCTCVYIYIYTHSCLVMSCACTYTRISVDTYTYVYVYTYTYIDIHMYAHIHTHTYIYMYIAICIYIYIYMPGAPLCLPQVGVMHHWCFWCHKAGWGMQPSGSSQVLSFQHEIVLASFAGDQCADAWALEGRPAITETGHGAGTCGKFHD